MLHVTSDGFLKDVSAINQKGHPVFPYLKSKKNSSRMGFDVTLTGNKNDYELVTLEELIFLIASGAFAEKGRVRMKPTSKDKGLDGGFSIRKATFSEKLLAEIQDILATA